MVGIMPWWSVSFWIWRGSAFGSRNTQTSGKPKKTSRTTLSASITAYVCIQHEGTYHPQYCSTSCFPALVCSGQQTIQNEFYANALRQTLHTAIEQLQAMPGSSITIKSVHILANIVLAIRPDKRLSIANRSHLQNNWIRQHQHPTHLMSNKWVSVYQIKSSIEQHLKSRNFI